jgi:hypothetical protein
MAFAVAVDFAYTGSLDVETIRVKYAQPDDDEDEVEEVAAPKQAMQQRTPSASTHSSLAMIDPAILQPRLPCFGTYDTKLPNTNPFQASSFTPATSPFPPPKSEPARCEPSNQDYNPYQQCPPTTTTSDAQADAQTEAEAEDSIRPTLDNLLVSTYALSEQTLNYNPLSNACITAYVAHLADDGIPSYWSLKHLQKVGLEESRLMKLMLRSISEGVRREGWRYWEDAGREEGEEVGFVVWCREGVGNMGMVMGELAGLGAEGIGKDVEDLSEGEVCRGWHVHGVGEGCGKRKRGESGSGGGKGEKKGVGVVGGSGNGAAKKAKK